MRVAQRRSRCIRFLLVLVVWGVPALAHAQDEAPTAPDETYDQVVVFAFVAGEPVAMHMLGRTFEAGGGGSSRNIQSR